MKTIMKKQLLIISIVALSFTSKAQTINGIKISELNRPYIEMLGTQKGTFSIGKIIVTVNYGESKNFKELKSDSFKLKHLNAVLDKNGKLVIFQNMVEALNYFNNFGYEYVDSTYKESGSQTVIHYMLRNTNYKK